MARAPLALLALLVTSCSSDPAPNSTGSQYPTDAVTLRAFLEAGKYTSWPHESVAHITDGPHNVNVRVYLSPELKSSLDAKNREHPKGVAAVKEIFGSAGKDVVIGWTYFVKLEATSAAGGNWYWYEVQDKSKGAVSEGKGLSPCKGCHMSGNDMVQSGYPLK